MKELSDWPFYEADISKLQLWVWFLSPVPPFFPYSTNQRLYMLRAAEYSAYALWCFPRCHSNLLFSTVWHIMGGVRAVSPVRLHSWQLFRSGAPHLLYITLYFCSFYMLLFTHLPFFYAWYLSSSRFPLGSCLIQLPTPCLSLARTSPRSPKIVSHQTSGLVGNGCRIPHHSPASLMLVKPVGRGKPVLITLIKGSLVPLAMPGGALERKEKICQMAWMSLR